MTITSSKTSPITHRERTLIERAKSHPVRQDILNLVQTSSIKPTALDIATSLDIEIGVAQRHINILVQAKLITPHDEPTPRAYFLNV